MLPLGGQAVILGYDSPAIGHWRMGALPALIIGSTVKIIPALSCSPVPARP